jgi:hypothetical protein
MYKDYYAFSATVIKNYIIFARSLGDFQLGCHPAILFSLPNISICRLYVKSLKPNVGKDGDFV